MHKMICFARDRMNRDRFLMLMLAAILISAIAVSCASSQLGAIGPEAPAPQSVDPQSLPRVWLEPDTLSVSVGDEFSISVLTDQEEGMALGAYEFHLRYDPAIVQATNVSDGGFLQTGGLHQVIAVQPHLDNEQGRLGFGAVLLGLGREPDPGVLGSGALAVLEMRAVGEGQTTLDFNAIILIRTNPRYPGREPRSDVPGTIAGAVVVVVQPGSEPPVAAPPTPYAPTPTPLPRAEIISTDPRETQLTFEGYADLPVWSPDGSKIAYMRLTGIRHEPSRSYLTELWTMNADGSDQQLIAANGGYPAFSPDGRYLLYLSWVEDQPQGAVWIADAMGQERRQVAIVDSGITPAYWLPNGRIGFVQDERLTIADSNGRVERAIGQVELNGNPALFGFQFSPDGSMIAYHQDRTLNLITSAGEHMAMLTTDLYPNWIGYAWSPDSKQLAYLVWTADVGAELWAIDADGTLPRRLVAGDHKRLGGPAWSPDGTIIAFTRTPRGTQTASHSELYFVHTDGSGLQRVTDNNLNESGPVWSPDGSRIAFTRIEMTHEGPKTYTIWLIDVR